MATFTENGALSYPNNDPLLDLFYRALRNTPEPNMREMVRKAWGGYSTEEDEVQRMRRLHTLKLLFFTRWCRGGKGERKMFYIALDELVQLGAGEHVVANLLNVPYFGYWRDLLHLADGELASDVLSVFTTQLKSDMENLNSGNEKLVTLAGKWAPSEGKQFSKLVPAFCRELGLNKREYRKECTVPLRKHLNIVETLLCDGRVEEVDYAHLPSLARLKYAKAFQKHDQERYQQYLNDVAAGKVKMNIKLVYPYQLVEKYLAPTKAASEYPDDRSLDVMWNELVKQTKAELIASAEKVGRRPNLQALGVADVSGSMSGVPMQNSVALSLLWSEICEGRFSGHFYTFSSNPKLVKIKGTTLKEKVQSVMSHVFYESTNVQAVFDDMLTHAGMWSLPAELYPQTVYMFTDGQFDQMASNGNATHLDVIQNKHSAAGYPMPQIVFWNLRGDTVDFPSPGNRKGVAMLSGFSPSLLKLILSGQELSPTAIMLEAISDPELDRVRLAE